MKTKQNSFLLFILIMGGIAMLCSPPVFAELSPTPLDTMPTANGAVLAIVPDGSGGVYIGGVFTELTRGDEIDIRNHIARINADGSVDRTWNPDASDYVYTLAVSGTTVYVGGDFNTIGGLSRNNIAALNNDGDATSWNPDASSDVRALAVSGSTIYVAGQFSMIGGESRLFIAALDADGNAIPWNPDSDGDVFALAVSGSTVYAGGNFEMIGGGSHDIIAALDATTAIAASWHAGLYYGSVRAIAVSETTVYIGGEIDYHDNIAALDATGSVTSWNPDANNDVRALAVSGSTVYAGGFFTTIGGKSRNHIAALDVTGSATSWDPDANYSVHSLAVSGKTLYAGGFFTTINGQPRSNFAAFAPNVAPIAANDSYIINEDTSLTVPAPGVLENDSDANNDPLTLTKVSDPSHGSVTLNSDGSFTYTPDDAYSGVDHFTYKTNDTITDSNIGTVTITVTSVNDPPAITDQVPLGTTEDTTLTIAIDHLTISDPDSSHFTLTVYDGSNYIRSGNTITPVADFNGTLTVPIKVSDSTDYSETFNLSITVTPVNDPPVITGQLPLSMLDDATLTITADHLIISDPDSSKFTLTLNDGSGYTLSGNTVTPDADFDGAKLTVPVKVNDGISDSNTFSLIVTITSGITCELSQSSITLGQPLQVSGRIEPVPKVGTGVDVALISPDEQEVNLTTHTLVTGEFSCDIPCGSIFREGKWKVRTYWAGDSDMAEAVSTDQALHVSRALTFLSLSARPEAIKNGDPVDIIGKLTPQPDCGDDLSDLPVKLRIQSPAGQATEVQVLTDADGNFSLRNYDGLNQLGDWLIQAAFDQNPTYLADESEAVRVQVVETAGYALIVQGRNSEGEGLASHSKTTQFVYEKLRGNGLLEDDIRYFSFDTDDQRVNGPPVKSAIEQAITVWAAEKMNERPANLYIVFVDHGLEETFFIHPQVIESSDLDGWLDILQNDKLEPQAADQEIVVMLGFCHSGSFIDDLSAPHRIIIASAAADETSYKGPLEEDGIRDGEYFMSAFFRQVSFGKSVRECFEKSVELTEMFTKSGSAQNNAPFYDHSLQHPLLDDNSDLVGSNELPDLEGDGHISKDIYIGVSELTDIPELAFSHVARTRFLGENVGSTDLWGQLKNKDESDVAVWLEVKDPDFSSSGTGDTGQAEMDLRKPELSATYNQTADRYEWNNLGGFTTPGTYQVFYFARDTETGNMSPPTETWVYKNRDGNTAPDSFDLVSPQDGETVLTTTILDWEDSTDPDRDRLTYTVLLSKEPFENEGPDNDPIHTIYKERLENSVCLVTEEDGLEDLRDYYWKVRAIDEYGAWQDTEPRMFHTDNTNAGEGYLMVHVRDSLTNESVTHATMNIGTMTVDTASGGGIYIGRATPGTYVAMVDAAGYHPTEIRSVVILEGQVTEAHCELDPEMADAPIFDLPPDTYPGGQYVELSSPESENAVIHYTTDGSDPDEDSPTYTYPFHISETTLVKAKTFEDGLAASETAEVLYTIEGTVALPIFSPLSGTYDTTLHVLISCPTPNARIHHTTDGSEPTTLSPTYMAPIPVPVNMTIRAKAFVPGAASDTNVALYTITGLAPPVLSIMNSEDGTGQLLEMSCAAPDAVIRYTTDGSEPTEDSPIYTERVPVSDVSVVRAKAFGFWQSSPTSSEVCAVERTSSPVFYPLPGTFSAARSIAVSSTTPDAVIHYTTDGSEPSERSRVYIIPISVFASATIRAKAYHPDMEPSVASVGRYTITGTIAAPVLSPRPGLYQMPQTVELSSATSGALIHYTTDGTNPTEDSPMYELPIEVAEGTKVITARAFENGAFSDISAGTYAITESAPEPVFSSEPGTYDTPQQVGISCPVPGAVICYTTDGTEPTAASPVHESPFFISATTLLRAKAFKDGVAVSETSEVLYTIEGTVANPVFSPTPGMYKTGQDIAISSFTPNAVIHYTMDGTDPDKNSPPYTTPISVNVNTVLGAKAYTAEAESATSFGIYTITGVAEPQFSIVIGSDGSRQVAISCATPGVIIRYTTDGTEPDENSPAYSGPVPMPEETVIRAKAFQEYGDSSLTAMADCILENAAMPVFSLRPGPYSAGQRVSLSSETLGALIRYTTDGSEPDYNSQYYTIPIPVFTTTLVRAKAYHPYLASSEISEGLFTIRGTVANPVFSPRPGTYCSEQRIRLSDFTPYTVIRYTTDGTEPGKDSPIYDSDTGISISKTCVIMAKAYLFDQTVSFTSQGHYTIADTIPGPVFSPESGGDDTALCIEIRCDAPDAVIRYTTDGTEPDENSSVYEFPISVSEDMTIMAKAYYAECGTSETVMGEYLVEVGWDIRLAKVVFVLQVLTEIEPQSAVCRQSDADADGDGRIGLADAIYLLKIIAGSGMM